MATRKYLKTSTKDSTGWDRAIAVLRGKFIVVQAFLKKEEESQTTNIPPKRIRKIRTQSPSVSRRKEIIED